MNSTFYQLMLFRQLFCFDIKISLLRTNGLLYYWDGNFKKDLYSIVQMALQALFVWTMCE